MLKYRITLRIIFWIRLVFLIRSCWFRSVFILILTFRFWCICLVEFCCHWHRVAAHLLPLLISLPRFQVGHLYFYLLVEFVGENRSATIISCSSTTISRSTTMVFFNQFFRIVVKRHKNAFYHKNLTFYHKKFIY